MSKARPIDTAPRDGTWILLFGGTTRDEYATDDESARPVVGQWATMLNGMALRQGRWQFAWYDGGYYGEYERPTHWMPIPELEDKR